MNESNGLPLQTSASGSGALVAPVVTGAVVASGGAAEVGISVVGLTVKDTCSLCPWGIREICCGLLISNVLSGRCGCLKSLAASSVGIMWYWRLAGDGSDGSGAGVVTSDNSSSSSSSAKVKVSPRAEYKKVEIEC